MDELRTKIAEIIGGDFAHMKADEILAIPEIAEALRVHELYREKPPQSGGIASISTNRRDPV